MKSIAILILAFTLFQVEFKKVQLVGSDNYPIENWRLIVFSNDGDDIMVKSNKEGELVISNEFYEMYKESHVKVIYVDYGLIKKLYKIPEDLKPENDQLRLYDLYKISKHKLERK